MKVTEAINRAKKEGRKALIIFTVAGDPNIELSKKIVKTIADAGADVIELSMPFSDPVADGPTIQKADERALKYNISLKDLFDLIKEIDSEVPISIMSYYNPIFVYGKDFVDDAENAGVSGIIIPDLPLEEGRDFYENCKEKGLDTILLATQLTDKERIKEIDAYTSGFIYYVTLLGVTGERNSLPADLKDSLKSIKTEVDNHIAVGFGIGNTEILKDVAEYIDGFIVGSALVKKIEENLNDEKKMLDEIYKFVHKLRKDCDKL